MYLNHPLVPDFPITLRYGEERDCEYLAGIFSEVWKAIPSHDQSEILKRGYGRVVVDVLSKRDFYGVANTGGDFRVKRTVVDSYPRKALLYHVAHKLAVKVDDCFHPNPTVRENEPRGLAKRRIATILERWGYPLKPRMEFTRADEERIRALHGLGPTDEDEAEEATEEEEAS
jgi:hypothetical protein